jgi:hypothetical protein
MFGMLTLLALASTSLRAAIASPALADRRSFELRDGVNYTVFEHSATRAKMSFVNNSGICETTPGVNQLSGYLTVGSNMVSYQTISFCTL